MINENINKTRPYISTEKPPEHPTTAVNDNKSEIILLLWEQPCISSCNALKLDTEDVFGYEMIIQGYSSRNQTTGLETYYALCKAKVYPKLLRVSGTDYVFKSNPVLKYSYSNFPALNPTQKHKDAFTVSWEEANLKQNVLSKEELNPEEVLQKFLGMIRFGIEKEILPVIKNEFNLFLANRNLLA